jgi:hypothetical protein
MDFVSMIICTKIFYNGRLHHYNGVILYIHHSRKLHRDCISLVELMGYIMLVHKLGRIHLII